MTTGLGLYLIIGTGVALGLGINALLEAGWRVSRIIMIALIMLAPFTIAGLIKMATA